MSLQVCNIHVENLLYDYLGRAIEHRQVIDSHSTFNVQS